MLRLSLPDDCTKESPLLVCVSGGADSVCLLLALHNEGYSCVVAHCNFLLRGSESDDDEHFVSQLSNRLNVPLVITHFDTITYATEHHISVEMAARDLRYQWFEEMRIKYNCSHIAVAHNLNDSVETFFLNLTRGTGIKGLTGISPVNGHIIRPLINIPRSQIESYLTAHNQTFRTDRTNSDTHYRRNRIRHNILPEFIVMNPSFLLSMRDTMENIASAEAAIHCPSSPQARRYELYSLLNPLGFSHDQIHQIWQAELSQTSGKVFKNDNASVVIDRGIARIYSTSQQVSESTESVKPTLDYEVFSVPRDTPLNSGEDFAFFDADKLVLPFSVRGYRAGDWFVPFGMKGRKKVSDFLTEQHLDIIQKANQQLLVDANDNIIWVIGQRTDNRFAVDNKTVQIAKVTIKKNYG
ncbi:MAG: tRNA lysidine(34) synthetase TilS [bacterium]|nr:tRNA lysidine(34) synthetase TilS [Candidatus Minthenecus merdequi]